MQSMFERLGNLLNETLKEGEVKFIHVEKNPDNYSDEEKSDGNENKSVFKKWRNEKKSSETDKTEQNVNESESVENNQNGDESESIQKNQNVNNTQTSGRNQNVNESESVENTQNVNESESVENTQNVNDFETSGRNQNVNNTQASGRNQNKNKSQKSEKKENTFSKAENSEHKKDYEIYHPITPEIERCYRLLKINQNASEQEIKKAYKDRLKYFHPDHYENNPVLKKIATEKTRQIMDAYEKILMFWGGNVK